MDKLHKVDILCLVNDTSESKIIENVSILSEINIVVEETSIDSSPSKIASVIKNTPIDSCLSPSSLDEVHISPEDNSDQSNVVDAFMESSTLIDD